MERYSWNVAIKAGISLEQFLATHFESPEPDFVDGEIIERAMPDWTHARLQPLLAAALENPSTGLAAATELRVRMPFGRSYISDVCAYPTRQEQPRYPTTPPIVAAEIVSEGDTHKGVIGKLEDYLKWGVPHVWLIDPWMRQLSVYNQQGLIHVAAFEIPEFQVRITFDELMAAVVNGLPRTDRNG